MNLIRLILLVTSLWVSLALAEVLPLSIVLLLLVSIWLLTFLKSKFIKLTIAVFITVIVFKAFHFYRPTPLFLKYYQIFNPNLTSLFWFESQNDKIKTYQNAFSEQLVFTESNWLSDGERMIHMSAIEPIVFLNTWLSHYNISDISYLGPTTPDLCQRVSNLKIKTSLFYLDDHADSASCGQKASLELILKRRHLIIYGPIEPATLTSFKEKLSAEKNTPWSVWHCSERLATKNPRNLPVLFQQQSLSHNYFLEFPFASCEISLAPNFYKIENKIIEDPILARLRMYSMENL